MVSPRADFATGIWWSFSVFENSSITRIFYPLEFEGFRREAGLNAFTLSPKKWIQSTDAISIMVKAGRGDRTFGKTLLTSSSNEVKLWRSLVDLQ